MRGVKLLQVKEKNYTQRYLKTYLKSKSFQRGLIGILTLIIAFAIIENGAAPKKYKLALGEKSSYDITAPRDIENRLRTEEMADEAAKSIPSVMIRLDNVAIDILKLTDDFFSTVEEARKSVEKSLKDQKITADDKDYGKKLELEQAIGAERLEENLLQFKAPLSGEQIKYLIVKMSDDDLLKFEKITKDAVGEIMKEEITDANLAIKVNEVQNSYQESEISQEMRNIGSLFVKAVLQPNSTVDIELTNEKKKEAHESALENKQIISEGTRILSYGDMVTRDKLEVLKELNLIESGRFDYNFAVGILLMVMMLVLILVLYMNHFCKKILQNRNDLILMCVIILMTLITSRILYIYTPLLIPVFIAPMLISILLDLRLAILVNFLLTVCISLITKGELGLVYITVISGTFSAFIVSKANQRSKLSASGLLVAGMNVLVIVCLGLLNKNTLANIANDSGMVALNGVLSTIFTIGILPFFESTFNIITPLKLLELANPNQPLIKRLLMEAPGTYHHSLMVGNLAEVATEAIEGNALLARVGAYYHDVGKLKRPNFFKENQLTDNPHDRMTPNLSTLVITSHTGDGVETAEKYKIPLAIKDIVNQHHGTTLVAYFYYKAKKGDKAETVKQEDFRYQGPRPSSKEAAVVMLADSVEAAVRSMVDKTEGKIEGLIRKIIKDKLDDGQLDLCELTLRDLDMVARAFLRVFGGFFHAREEYPEIKIKNSAMIEDTKMEEPGSIIELPKQIQENTNIGASPEKEKMYYENF